MVAEPQAAAVLPFAQARHVVEQHAGMILGSRLTEMEVQAVPLLEAPGRVLAEELRADRDFPPFSRAARDGYAVRAADVSQVPATLRVVGEIKAGAMLERTLRPGEAAAIMTGAPAPSGADAIVMVEYTAHEREKVVVQRSVHPGENIVPMGSEARQGEVLLKPGHRVDFAAVALGASLGKEQLRVYPKPRVAILGTGDEIVPISAMPGPSQIRNSNTYSLAVQVQNAGGEPVLLPVAPDEPDRLRELIKTGLNSDLLLLTGGVSMGKYDLVEQALEEIRGEFFFTGALIQPGRPIVFGRALDKYFFGLPGNPVSTMVTFALFVAPMLEGLSGTPITPLHFLQARLKSDVKTKIGLTRFLPARLSGEFQNTEVALIPWQGSGDIASMAQANCYLVVPPDRERIAAGEMVCVLMR